MSAPYPDQNQPLPAYPNLNQMPGAPPPGAPMQAYNSPYPPHQSGQPMPGQMPMQHGQMPYGQQPAYGQGPPMGGQPMYQQPGMMMTPQQPHNPNGENWMAVPQGIPGCPAGLEYLTQIDQLLVKQKVEMLEMMTGMETNNKYKVKNSMGQDIYKAKEKSDFCTRQCCGPIRCFQLEITDNTDREVIHLDRPLNCSTCCFPCCLQEMTVTSPISGETLGKIKQRWHPCLPIFEIQDADGNTVLEMEGPFCAMSCCNDVNFPIKTTGGQEVGKITKQWTGMVKEAFTDADNFGVSFPMDLDVKTKATLLGAVFLIDFMFFEQANDNQQSNQWG